MICKNSSEIYLHMMLITYEILLVIYTIYITIILLYSFPRTTSLYIDV